jgi:hypothetical protein
VVIPAGAPSLTPRAAAILLEIVLDAADEDDSPRA